MEKSPTTISPPFSLAGELPLSPNAPRLVVIMACGHAADSMTQAGEVFCSQCFGETIKAFTPRDIPNIERLAECMDCGRLAPSNPSRMAFYTYRDNQETDRYWCRCHSQKR